MSFCNEKSLCYLVNQFYYFLPIKYIKMQVMLKRQRFKDSESDKMESSILKYQRLDIYNKKERQGLDKYEDEDEDKKYIFLSFIALFLYFQRESNHLTDLNEGIRSLNDLVCLLRICYLEKC